MKIEVSIEELKLLFKNFELKEEKKTPVDGTTDVKEKVNQLLRLEGKEQI